MRTKRTVLMIASVFIVIAMTLALVPQITDEPVSADADPINYHEGSFNYILYPSTHKATVYSFEDTTYTGNVTIPGTVTYESTDYAVTTIGPSSFAHCKLTAVELPNSVTEIDHDAFWDSDLASISLSNVTTIRQSAFSCCKLTNLTIPTNVTTIETHAFVGNEHLINVTITGDHTINGSIFLGSIISGTLTIGNGTILLNDEVTDPYGGPFDHTTINNIVLDGSNNSSISVGNYSFKVTSGVSKLTVRGTVSFGLEAFNASEVSNVEFTDGFTGTIGTKAFVDCFNLETVKFVGGTGNVSFEERCFYNSGLKSITIPTTGNVTIGASAFAYCDNLSEITIPSNVSAVGAKAFRDTASLQKVVINENAERTWGAKVFWEDAATMRPFPDGEYITSKWKGISDFTIEGNIGIGYTTIIGENGTRVEPEGTFPTYAPFANGVTINIVGDSQDITWMMPFVKSCSVTGNFIVTSVSESLTVKGTLDLTNNTLTVNNGGKLIVSSSGTIMGGGIIDFSSELVQSGSEIIVMKSGATVTCTLSSSTNEKFIMDSIIAGVNGITVTKGSIYVDGIAVSGDYVVPDGSTVHISGTLDAGVTLTIEGNATVIIPENATLTFEEGSKLDNPTGTINVASAGSSVIYEKGAIVNNVIIEVETKEDSNGTTTAVRIYLVSENEKKLVVNIDYVEVLPGKTYGDAMAGVTATPVKKTVTFDGWYNLAFGEKIRSGDIVGNNDVTLTACYIEDKATPVIPDKTASNNVNEAVDFALPAAFILLVVAIFALGYVIVVKKK